MALCPAAANDQDMDKRYLKAGSGLLAVGVVLAIWDLAGGVGLKTGGLDLGGITACYASGTSGLLVADAWAGTAIIEQDGDRYPVTWPIGFTGRRCQERSRSSTVAAMSSRGPEPGSTCPAATTTTARSSPVGTSADPRALVICAPLT